MNCKLCWIGCFALSFIGFASPGRAVDFEDLSLSTEPFYNGSDGAGGFSSGGASFPNNYNSQYNSWIGWSYSNMTDGETQGFGNQYSAYPASGGNGSATPSGSESSTTTPSAIATCSAAFCASTCGCKIRAGGCGCVCRSWKNIRRQRWSAFG